MPISAAPSSIPLTTCPLGRSCRSTFRNSWALKKPDRSSGRNCTIADRLASMRTWPRTPCEYSVNSTAIFSIFKSATRAWCSSASPAGVRVMPFASRSNRVTPNASSKSAIRLLTADAAMPSRDAARVRFFSSQTAMNSRSVVRSIRRSSALCAVLPLRGPGGARSMLWSDIETSRRFADGTLPSSIARKISNWRAMCRVLGNPFQWIPRPARFIPVQPVRLEGTQKRGAEGAAFSCSMSDLRPFVRSARRGCRNIALALHDDLVERPEIGLGRGHQRVRIGSFRRHRAALMGEPNRNFGLRIGTLGDGMDLIQLQLGLVRHQRLDAVEHRVHRAVAFGFLDFHLAFDVELHGGALRPMGAGDHRQRNQLDPVMRGRDF